MTTPEERELAALLRGEADQLGPLGPASDGLDRIRGGIARRRTRRRVALSASALGLAAVVVAGAALTGGGGATSLEPIATQPPTSSPTVTPTPTASPIAADPDGSTTSQPGTPFFPFTSDAQAADWAAAPGDRAWADDPVQVAQHLVDDLLALEGVRATRDTCLCDDRAIVTLQAGDAAVGRVQLARLGTGSRRPWAAMSVDASATGQLSVTSPRAGTEISSPLTVTGTVQGVDENVRVSLRTATGTLLAEGGAPAGSEQPWSTTLRWTADDWTTGVVTAVTRSPRDGAVNRVVAVPVRRDPTPRASVPGPTEAFAAEKDGVVGLYSVTDGERLVQVSFPPAGYTDTSPRRTGTIVMWLRLGRECTDRTLVQRDLATDTTTTLVADQPLVPGALAVSPDGRWRAWAVRAGCETGPTTISLQGPSGIRTIEQDENGDVAELDVRDDGALLVGVAGEDGGSLGLFQPGATRPVPLDAAPGCLLFNGGFVGDRVVGLELCDPFSADPKPLRRVELTLTGDRVSAETTTLRFVERLATADGQVLVQTQDPKGTVGRLVGTRFEPFLQQPACAQTLEAKGCVTGIDW